MLEIQTMYKLSDRLLWQACTHSCRYNYSKEIKNSVSLKNEISNHNKITNEGIRIYISKNEVSEEGEVEDSNFVVDLEEEETYSRGYYTITESELRSKKDKDGSDNDEEGSKKGEEGKKGEESEEGKEGEEGKEEGSDENIWL